MSLITIALIRLVIKWIRQNRPTEEIIGLLRKRKLDGIVAAKLVDALRGSPVCQEKQE